MHWFVVNQCFILMFLQKPSHGIYKLVEITRLKVIQVYWFEHYKIGMVIHQRYTHHLLLEGGWTIGPNIQINYVNAKYTLAANQLWYVPAL